MTNQSGHDELASFQRLLYIVPWMRLGGADRFNLSLVKELSRRGIRVTLCATIGGDNPWQAEFARYTSDVQVLPQVARPDEYPGYVARLIESRQIDVVLISHSMLGYAVLPYLRSVCPNVTYVDYNHMVATVWRGGGYARMSVNYQKYLDLNIASSEQVRRWMVDQGGDAERIEVCYTNIDVAEWDPGRYDRAALRQAMGIPAGLPVILFPARLEPQKRPRVLANILLGLKRRGRRFQCLVAGDGSQLQWLAGYIARHQLDDSVRLLGPLAPARMPELMAASDVLLLPSRDEGIAVSIFEAMAMGVVPVSADVGGQRELITPETGFLLPHALGEVYAYVNVLDGLLGSPDRRQALGRAARARVSQYFTIEQMAERMAQLLAQAQHLARGTPRPRVSQSEGQMLARQAVENLRWDRLQELLRLDQPQMSSDSVLPAMQFWQHITYSLKQRILRPAYSWGLRQGYDWLEPFANEVYRLLRGVLR